jgi:pilus assembly protein Flp/PilA
MNSSASLKRFRKGQGMVEYALILVLVSLVVIAALMILGPTIGNVFSQINSSLSNLGAGGGGGGSGATEVPSACDPAFQQACTATGGTCVNSGGVDVCIHP